MSSREDPRRTKLRRSLLIQTRDEIFGPLGEILVRAEKAGISDEEIRQGLEAEIITLYRILRRNGLDPFEVLTGLANAVLGALNRALEREEQWGDAQDEPAMAADASRV